MNCGNCGSPDPCVPTIHVVDDDEAIRHSLAFLLKSLGVPVECHPSAEAFLAARKPGKPGCVVLDVRMPGMSGLELQALLNRAGETLGIVFLSGHGDIPMAVQAMSDGAVHFLEKPCNDEVLLEQVERALNRSRDICGRAAAAQAVQRRVDTLTQREKDVMALVVQGKPNKVIAFELDISIKTVEVHRAHVMEKMQADSVADLTRMLMATA
ncbi:response regulator transcription factor [Magnetospirillum aberrantis]|uniref:Response regulator transcription factor n=1 Tax=Magnetospirillum aberrantis SpK TaxID=908842 RepID=A0A7C9QUQ8_9PROT|nr:response regulator transcription factor [Magnetospirillum aberrantis]NFV79756.1 response regulator transcription factor [Magnetospirillum aberrantis SpK]